MMRVDRALEDFARSPSSDMLAAAGVVGLYLFTLKS